MSETEINELLADWLEPKATLPSLPDELCCDVDMMLAEVWRAVSYYREGDVVRWEAPDFFKEEKASALLLEAMPYARLYHDKKHGIWVCESDWRFFHNEAKHKERKSAVVYAAVGHVKEERKHNENTVS